MRNRSIARAIKVGIGTILTVVVLFFVFSWIAEYRPAGRETTLYDKTEPEYLPDTLTVVSWNIGYAGLGDNMDFFMTEDVGFATAGQEPHKICKR